MITITSKINDIQSFFNTLKQDIGGQLNTTDNEYIFELDQRLGYESIRSILLEDGVSVLELDLETKDDVLLSMESLLSTHVNFVYCSKGSLSHSFDNGDSIDTIETFQTSILTNIRSKSNTILVEKDTHTVATIICVDTSHKTSVTSQWMRNIKQLFIDEQSEDYLYVGSYNLKIADSIKQLQAIKQEGLVRALLIKGIVNMILALEIENHQHDIANADMATTTLNKSDITAVEELTEYINNYPDLEHRIDKLTKKVGLSAAKIQEGFKFKHGLTVCEYIRSVRLTKSEELISNTDLNISEIVYSLGFSSRSYFSKIFKERYNCSPMHYKKNKLAVSA